ncbi:cupin-like domain-containing protein [Pengzhenrongella sp.]|jgi:lysine-specific demethylase 8|uniref:cupin-like domain-containing protein n=1 Tax=Pengzhenrongella sp. TaxID=2888820 RepID=UPI002F94FB94
MESSTYEAPRGIADLTNFRSVSGGTPPAGAQGRTSQVLGREPLVLRSAAAAWPAIRRWTFAYLASLSPDRTVQLVVGSRETSQTRFETSTLGEYLLSLDGSPASGAEPRYLKEFDLLAESPRLRDDVRRKQLFPPGSLTSSTTWIGPAGARTGLHHDLLDNLAVQLVGRKRFYLARPGTVETAGAVSPKYDQWARLSLFDVAQLAADGAASQQPNVDFFVVDLEPGDVLYIPATWWHEVENLTPSVLLSGFFGPRLPVCALWARVAGRHVAHRLGLVGRAGCTCHARRTTRRTKRGR